MAVLQSLKYEHRSLPVSLLGKLISRVQMIFLFIPQRRADVLSRGLLGKDICCLQTGGYSSRRCSERRMLGKVGRREADGKKRWVESTAVGDSLASYPVSCLHHQMHLPHPALPLAPEAELHGGLHGGVSSAPQVQQWGALVRHQREGCVPAPLLPSWAITGRGWASAGSCMSCQVACPCHSLLGPDTCSLIHAKGLPPRLRALHSLWFLCSLPAFL